LKDHANRDIVLIMVGNKQDLADDNGGSGRAVTKEQAEAMGKELDVPTIETSAKSGSGVDEAFTSVIERIYANTVANKGALGTNQSGGKTGAGNSTAGKSVSLTAKTTEEDKMSLRGCCKI